MTPHYMRLWEALRVADTLDKYAAAEPDVTVAELSAIKHAEVCNELVDMLRSRAGLDDATKEAAAVGIVDFVLDLRETHEEVSGVKCASDNELVLDASSKLATAVYVDSVLTEQIDASLGETKTAALAARTLGREYIVYLTSLLMA